MIDHRLRLACCLLHGSTRIVAAFFVIVNAIVQGIDEYATLGGEAVNEEHGSYNDKVIR